jgi:hypothetical protein
MHDLVKAAINTGEAFADRSDWGGFLMFHDDLADAMGWECDSCRPEVGWPKRVALFFPYGHPIDDLEISIECGHCGQEHTYDADLDKSEAYHS